MKAYKGFNRDLTCRGFQFEVGKTYHEEEAELCKSGFHACENPLDCFGYYAPGDSVYHEVELDEVSDERSNDTKLCGKTITIGSELSVAQICKLHFEYISAKCTPVDGNVAKNFERCSGVDMSSLAGGNWSSIAGGDGSSLSGGYSSSIAGGDGSSLSGGDGSRLAGGNWSSLSGGYSSSIAGGDGSSLSGGDGSRLAGGDRSILSGGYSSSIAGGYSSSIAGGDRSILSGGYSSSIAGGNWSTICARSGKVKGGVGSLLCCGEIDDDFKLIGYAAGIVDGENIKADTWYTVKNGKFVEVEAEGGAQT